VVFLKQYTILHTIETSGPGGAETVLLELATRLDRSRFRSLVLLNQAGWLLDQLKARGIKTTLVDWRAWGVFSLPRSMAKVVRDERVDLIHSHLPDQNFYSCLVGKLTRCKTVVTYHGPIELVRAKQRRAAFKLWAVRRSASTVVVVCDRVRRLLGELMFPPEKITRIYNGIDVTRFNTPRKGCLKEELGFPRETKLVGMVANVRQTKGHDFFIRAARRVADAHPQVRFLAVGDVDERLGRGLRSLVQQLDLGDRFFFLGFRQDIPDFLGNLDIFVLPSTSEGFPLVVLEAMAAGKPVVATRSGGPEEIIRDGHDGFLVPPADAETLSAKISELLEQPELAAAVAHEAQLKIARQFSIEQMIREYAGLYERTISPAETL
jgi:glycosyltransferase involved in cell wall biosynthesis